MIAPLLVLLAQSASLPPANPLPPPGSVEAAVMTPITGLFAALAARDGQAMLPYLRAEGGGSVATEQPDGTRSFLYTRWADFVAGIKPGPERYEERLTDVAVDIDGDIAMVWGTYVFLIDGKPHHCGVDHFDLVREAGAWKILNLTWSKRTRGCGG